MKHINITKHIIIISIAGLSALLFSQWYQSVQKHPTPFIPTPEQIVTTQLPLVVVLMVKNEADFMEKTLHPFIQAGVQGYLILDTGSTDETVARTRKLFSDKNIQYGYIVEQPFIDFATSRNYAMECAEQLFPNALFFFMIDAEWYTQNVLDLLKYCYAYRNEPIEALKIYVHYKDKEYYVTRILKADKKVRFKSVVHEYAQVKTTINLPKNIFVDWDDSSKGYEKSKERWKKDIKLLLQQHKNDPNDLRTLYYIGQTYCDLQDYDNAIAWYKKRYENTEGWIEERLLSCYKIARIYDVLKNWPLALDYYLKAYELKPQRVEPLIYIAQHYFDNKDNYTCYLFALQAAKTPVPADAIQLEPKLYQDTRFDLLSLAAWNIGEYEISEQAIKKALEYAPNDQHFLSNFKKIQDRKKQITQK